MNYRAISCALGIMLSSACADADQRTARVASTGDTVISASANGLNVRLRIATREIQIGKPSDVRPKEIRTSCTYSRYPCSVVELIEISVNGRRCIAQRSVFADLADLNTADLNVEKGIGRLTLTGGDASEAYIVTIEFDKEHVTRRTVSTFDNDLLQETNYHLVVLGE